MVHRVSHSKNSKLLSYAKLLQSAEFTVNSKKNWECTQYTPSTQRVHREGVFTVFCVVQKAYQHNTNWSNTNSVSGFGAEIRVGSVTHLKQF